MANFGPLTAEIGLPVWGTPANFIRFIVLPSSLRRRRSLEAKQTLHDIWPSPGLVHYVNIFGGFCRLTEFCQVQNSHYVQVLRSPILAALLHGTPAAGVSQTLQRGTKNGIMELSQRAPPIFGWRPWRWASAHILVNWLVPLSFSALIMSEWKYGLLKILLEKSPKFPGYGE